MSKNIDELERRIQRLEDIEMIKGLISGWARAGDSLNDPAGMAATLTEDALCEIQEFGRYQGREEIVTQLRKIAEERIKWSIHFMTTPVIKFNDAGTKATVFWYVWEAAKARESTGDEYQSTWIAGWYENIAVKINNEWRFSHVNVTFKLLTPITEKDWEVLAPGRNPLPGPDHFNL